MPFKETDLKTYALPDDAIGDLVKEQYFDSDVAGRIRLGGESLQLTQLSFLCETKNKKRKAGEPPQKYNGRYVCDAISLADSDYNNEGEFDGQILVWIPQLKCFASWDREHEQSYVFPDISWATISKDLAKYACAQWEPVKGGKEIWDVYELWKIFPYVPYASDFLSGHILEIEACFKERDYLETQSLCSRALEDANMPLLGESDIVTSVVEFYCYRSFSNFLLKAVEAAVSDLETALLLAAITIKKDRMTSVQIITSMM